MLRKRLQSLAANRRQVERNMTKAVRSQGPQRTRRVSASQIHCARALMALQNGEPTASIRFLATAARKSSDMDIAQQADSVRTWWCSSTLQERTRITDEAVLTPPERAALTRARKFLFEADLEAWVDNQNVGKGITPRSAVVLEAADAMSAGRELPMRAIRKRKCAFQWLRRWRQRWAVHVASMAANEVLPVPQLQEKARRYGRGRRGPGRTPWPTKNQDHGGTVEEKGGHFPAPKLGSRVMLTHKTGPESDPHFSRPALPSLDPLRSPRGCSAVEVVQLPARKRGDPPKHPPAEHGRD